MSIQLKVKVSTLAAEARIIRNLERARKRQRRRTTFGKPFFPVDPTLLDLQLHRRVVVRKKARASLLAYGFLRGRPYRTMERFAHTAPDWARVERMILKFGSGQGEIRDLKQRFEEWKEVGLGAVPVPVAA